jgi:hypothetical protein
MTFGNHEVRARSQSEVYWRDKYERLKRRADKSHKLFVEFMRLTLDFIAKAEPMLEEMVGLETRSGKYPVRRKLSRRTFGKCVECGLPIYLCPSGYVCDNGHGFGRLEDAIGSHSVHDPLELAEVGEVEDEDSLFDHEAITGKP